MKILSIVLFASSFLSATSQEDSEVNFYNINFRNLGNVTDDCGNGVCDEGENCLSCAVDCISGVSGGFECGNGVCEDGETCYTCPQDCMSGESISDSGEPDEGFCCFGGKKNPGMSNAASCSDPRCFRPGKGISCDGNDKPFETFCCGDGVCGGDETSMNCPIDNCVELCGNGVCDEADGENAETCESDCPCNLDGVCDSFETVSKCELDCTCGNNVCDVDLGENVANCMLDCACNANGNCEAWEDAKHCPQDCRGQYKQGDAGSDGKKQQFDGSSGYEGDGDSDSGDSGDDGTCFENAKACDKHDDCCSFACDMGNTMKCVG